MNTYHLVKYYRSEIQNFNKFVPYNKTKKQALAV